MTMSYRHWCDGADTKIPLARKLLREGRPLKEVAHALGMSTEGARRLLRRYEVPLPTTRRYA